MAAKPNIVPLFATSATYPAGVEPEAGDPNKVAPAAATIASGWRPDQKPPADEFNYLMNLYGLWAAYLNDQVFDGTLTVDDLVVNDTALISGDATFESSVEFNAPVYHGDDRSHVQGFDGGTTSGAALSFNHSALTATIAAGNVAHIPCRAPLMPGVSRIKSISILFENNSIPNVSLYTKTGPAAIVEVGPALGVTNSTVAVGVNHTRKTTVINAPVRVGQTDRVFLRIENIAGSGLVCHELIVTYDAPRP